MHAMARRSEDPVVRAVQNTLDEYAYSEVIGQKYNWKYLPDERFQELCSRLSKDRRFMKLIGRSLAIYCA
jgi:hypothetical protein